VSRTLLRVGDEGVEPYPLMTALVVPRPIAWVSTVDAEGHGNLAPHSFFTVACAKPPIVAFTSVGRKDTLRNVLATGELVVNLATQPLTEAVNASSAPYDPDVDEAEALGLAMEPSELVAPRRVSDSPAAMECRLHSTHELGDSTLVLAEVLLFSVADEVLVDGHPEFSRLAPMTRLGKQEWAPPSVPFDLPRPTEAP
jgi:flavin reductase (DIM6/NTAB) family NADH-FMN oxidoreductase RutF